MGNQCASWVTIWRDLYEHQRTPWVTKWRDLWGPNVHHR